MRYHLVCRRCGRQISTDRRCCSQRPCRHVILTWQSVGAHAELVAGQRRPWSADAARYAGGSSRSQSIPHGQGDFGENARNHPSLFAETLAPEGPGSGGRDQHGPWARGNSVAARRTCVLPGRVSTNVLCGRLQPSCFFVSSIQWTSKPCSA